METTGSHEPTTRLISPGPGRLRTAARWVIILLLAWSAGGKLVFPTAFGDMLRTLGLLPGNVVPLVQYGLPYLELLLALSLAARLAVVPTLLGCLFLSLVFGAVQVLILVSGTVAPGGCLGVSFSHASWANQVILLLVSVVIGVSSQLLLFADQRRRC